MTAEALSRASDHAVKWLGLAVAILTLITLWEAHRLHRIELRQKGVL
jgi:hypothetical protein